MRGKSGGVEKRKTIYKSFTVESVRKHRKGMKGGRGLFRIDMETRAWHVQGAGSRFVLRFRVYVLSKMIKL